MPVEFACNHVHTNVEWCGVREAVLDLSKGASETVSVTDSGNGRLTVGKKHEIQPVVRAIFNLPETIDFEETWMCQEETNELDVSFLIEIAGAKISVAIKYAALLHTPPTKPGNSDISSKSDVDVRCRVRLENVPDVFTEIIKSFVRSNFMTERKKELQHIRKCNAKSPDSVLTQV